MATTNDYVLKRLEMIEAEIAELKRLLGAKPSKRRKVTLEGIWKGADITDDDIEEAKQSLFKPAYDDSL